MTAAESLIPLLWPPGFETRGTELYAILDGARDPRIHRLVTASNLAWRCLYAGALPPELLEVAPYLVRMHPDAAFTRTLLSVGWGHAWGIWLVSAAPFDDLRRHLRRFLRVKDERGRRLLFRYYDPIVLAAFLPTCTVPELAELFGPIDALLVETGSDSDLTELRFDGVVLHTKIRAAMDPPRVYEENSGAESAQPYSRPRVYAATVAGGTVLSSMLVIRNAQMAAFMGPFIAWTIDYLRRCEAERVACYDDHALRALIFVACTAGARDGIDETRLLLRYVLCLVDHGSELDSDAEVRAILGDRASSPDARMNAVCARAPLLAGSAESR